MVAVMDRCGVSGALVASHLAIEVDAVQGNVETARMVEASQHRLAGLLTVNPHQDPESTLETWREDHRFAGIKLHPDLHEYPVTGARYAPVWDASVRWSLPVLVHTWSGSDYDDPAMLARIAERYPDARIMLGHSGALRSRFEETAELVRARENLVLEICGSNMTSWWLRYLVDRVGAGKVAFGSDFPFIDLRYSLGRVLFAGLSDDDLELVLGGTVRRMLREGCVIDGGPDQSSS